MNSTTRVRRLRVASVLLAAALTLQCSVALSEEVAAAGRLEVAFSPDGGAQALLLRVISSAHHDVRVLSYTFTSSPVTKALIAARGRGVTVSIVADAKNNLQEDQSGRARQALTDLARAGCDVRVIDAFALQHDKLLIVDSRTTELGSFNYTGAADRRNSETMLVVWDNPELARRSLEHFARNYALSTPFVGDAR